MIDYIRGKGDTLIGASRAKFYVALTRASLSVAIVFDYKDNEILNGVFLYT
jgi:hypothetical protein